MTPETIATIVTALGVAFGRPVTPEALDVYAMALADLDLQESPRAFVARWVKTEEWMPPPAKLRRAILESQGALAPDEDRAWAIARVWAIQAAANSELAPPILEAVKTVGGSWAIRHGQESIVLAQFREAYRTAKARWDRGTMEADYSLALEAGHAPGLPAPQ